MSRPLTGNPGLPLAHLSLISTSSFPSLHAHQTTPPEANIARLTKGQQTGEPHQLRQQRLIQHSMDSELFGNSRQQNAGDKAQAALMKGMQKQVSAYTITQEQRNLINSSRPTLGYA